MMLSVYITVRTACLLLCRQLATINYGVRRRCDRGQTTAEYALVIVGAAAVALLLLAWATDTDKITGLLDKIVGAIADKVR